MIQKRLSALLKQRVSSTTIKLLILPIGLSMMSTAAVAQWRVEPLVRLAIDFNDNPFQSIGTEDGSESGYIAEGSVNVGYASETTDFSITPQFRSRAYGGDADLDSDDQFLRAQFNHITPRADFRVRTSYDRQSVRTAERADTDFDIDTPDDIDTGDTGRIDIRDRRERLRFSPSLLYRFSDVSAVSARVDYNDVRYDESLQGSLIDYADTRLEVGYRRSFTPRNTGIILASYRNYQTDEGSNEIDGIGFNVGFDRQLSATTRLRATAGLEDTEVFAGDSEVEWVANVSVARRLETTTLLAQYRRNINASGSGRLGARDSINLNFVRDLSEKASAGIGARVYSTDSIGTGLAGIDERSYVQLRSQFTWRFTEAFSVEANYRYTFIDRAALVESSNGNQVTIWFSYRPQPFTPSR